MADENAENQAQGAEGEAPKKGGKKVIIIVAVAMVVEALVIAGVFMMNQGPSDVQALTELEDAEKDANRPVEILVAADKFQNTRSGKPFLFDTEVHVITKTKHEEVVNEKIENMQSRISSDITTIFLRAEPAYLNEPERQTLTRQIKASLEERLGTDPDGENYVLDVVISRMKRFNADL